MDWLVEIVDGLFHQEILIIICLIASAQCGRLPGKRQMGSWRLIEDTYLGLTTKEDKKGEDVN